MTFYDAEEWSAAEQAAKDELSLAYSNSELDVPSPVDYNLTVLARRIAKAAIRTVNHYQGTERYYDYDNPERIWKNVDTTP